MKNRKTKTILAFLLVVVLLTSFSGAYMLYCLDDGQQLPPGCSGSACRFTCNLNSGSGFCQVCTTDLGNPGVNPLGCNGQLCSFLGDDNGGTTDINPPIVTINSPMNGQTYSSTRVMFDIDVDSNSRIEYYDGKWHKLCDSCTSYSRHVKVEEGANELVIKVKKLRNNMVVESTKSFSVDSKAPKCLDSLPEKNEFASGVFNVEYSESNLDKIELYYKGLNEGSWNIYELQGCNSGENVFCSATLNLDEYENGELEYYFNVCDGASCNECKIQNVRVDSTQPILTQNTLFEGLSKEKKILFDFSVNEEVEIYYVDNNDDRGREKKLCSKCNYVNKPISFKDGEWDITVFARDDAGNVDEIGGSFFVDTKEPKIRKTYPKKGFVSGIFEVEFQEDNPAELVLFYGEEQEEVDINDCLFDRGKFSCIASVDVGEYDGERISYWFELSDVVGNTVQSKIITLDVDISFPEITAISHEMNRNKAEIVLEIDEENLDEVSYINHDDKSPRERKFCSKLKGGACEKKIRLNDGLNRFTFFVLDEAGNLIAEDYEILL